MATRYRLPEALGGGECSIVERDPALILMGKPAHVVMVESDDEVTYLVVQQSDITPIKPPLPDEPPFGSVVHARLANEDVPWAFERSDPAPNGNDWYTPGSDNAYSWADLCAIEPPVRLVPDPFAEPVALPWSAATEPISSLRPTLYVEAAVLPGVHITARPFGDGQWQLSPAVARAMARAVMAAADAAEKEQS